MLQRLRVMGWVRGIRGGSRAWTLLWATLVTGRLLHKRLGRTAEVLTTERLAPGQTLVVRSLGPRPTRRQRRRARRAAAG